MEENEQDVNVDPSTTEQNVIPEPVQQEETEGQGAEQEAQVEVEPQTAPVRQTEVTEEYDNMGVPLKNRLAEAQRKLQELDALKEQVKQLSQAQSQPAQTKYTSEELRAFAAATDDPQHRQWALAELDKVTKQEFSSIVENRLQSLVKQQQEQSVKQQTFNSVLGRNPDIAIKDTNGNFQTWNSKSPMFQRISFYMQNPEIGNHPRGLEVAEGLAARDIYVAQKPVTQKKITQQTNQLKSLQKKVMVEGAGNNAQQGKSSRQEAIERVKQTGSMKDAEVAMGHILRDSGILKD